MDNQLTKRGRKGLGAILGKVPQNAFCLLRKEAEQEASKGEEKGLLLIVKLDKVSPTSADLRFLSWHLQEALPVSFLTRAGCGGPAETHFICRLSGKEGHFSPS